MGHRRFLSPGHKFRMTRNRFDGKEERRNPPPQLSGVDILRQVDDIEVVFGKNVETDAETQQRRSRGQGLVDAGTQQWRKKSIFFKLPY